MTHGLISMNSVSQIAYWLLAERFQSETAL
jgi:hypothetical protein